MPTTEELHGGPLGPPPDPAVACSTTTEGAKRKGPPPDPAAEFDAATEGKNEGQ